MNPSREELLFGLALEQSAEKRTSFLDAVCAGDAALRQRLNALLAAHESAESRLPEPAENSRPTLKVEAFEATVDESIGQTIGRYKLLEKVGEGGYGFVYVAEQTEPVRRRVALKVIKLGMDTKAVVARFEAERQALAMMDHPNIARVLDAGTTDAGRPYFVMELVRGVKITQYCDHNHLTTRERLDLFIKVCQAIQHAHQKGIIHRDIKPSNILVTLHDGVPVPKVIDFGIAKATEGRLTDATVYTQLHQFIGTPAYMSPEQAEMSGLDIDTRSDIYSLGVLLYELLTSKTPFDAQELMSQGFDAMRKTIREREPARPSTKLATLQGEDLTTTAKGRSADAAKLLHQLRGDLDWIVMKCLEKDRTRRYETANGLAADLKRHLNNEPVVARPPSTAYRFQKAVRRNKLVFTAGGAVGLALLLGIIATTLQSVRASRARKEALAARRQAEANAEKAVVAQSNEAKLREQAEAARRQAQADELTARQRAYASDMNVAKQALAGSNLGRALDLLNRQRPRPGQKDLRGWEWRYLWAQTHSDALFTLCQKGEIESLTTSADGHWLAVGMVRRDGLFVYDLQTRQEVAHLAPGEGDVRATFSPTDSLLAFTSAKVPLSGKQQYRLRLWDAAARRMMTELPLDALGMELSFSRNGKTLVTSMDRGHITLWRIPDGTQLANYPSEQATPLSPAVSFAATADLGLAAYGTDSGEVRVIDLTNGRQQWSAIASKEYITALAFSPDGKMLASAAGFGEGDIRLWDVPTGKELGRLEGHKSWVGSLVFWPDGKKLASSSADQTIRIWDIVGRQALDVLRGHRLEVWRLALLPDEKTLISGCKDGTVNVWDTSVLHPRAESITWPVKIYSWCFAADSQSVVTFDRQGEVRRWSGTDFRHQEKLLAVPPFDGSKFSNEARFLAVGSTNGHVSIWDLPRRVLRRQIQIGEGAARPLSFIARGNHLLCHVMPENRFLEWDLEADREVQSWPAPPISYIWGGFNVSPDERLAIGVGWSGDVSGRNLQSHSNTNVPLDAVEGWRVAFSADGKRLAVASALGFTRIWDTATWRDEATLVGFLNAANSVVFSPNGQRIATGSTDPADSVRLWDVGGWQEVFTLEGTGFEFDATSFSPNGNTIGTVSSDGSLRVWRAPSAEDIAAEEAKESP
jgi:serine/threonine protein kinase/WD40 repeat protein